MTTHTLRRWGAVLLTGGLFMTAAYLIFPSSAHSSLIRPAASLALVGVLLSLPGLVAYQRGQSLRARASDCCPSAWSCWRWRRGEHLAAEAHDGEEALRALNDVEVDVALLDVNMPGLNGIGAASRIATEAPEVAVLMLTMFADDASVFAALRAGARGYVLKESGRDELLRAIRAVAHGEAIFSPSIATRVLDFLARPHPSIAPEAFPMLTTRERDVLHLIAQARTNPQIAAELGLSRKTTSNYVSAILTKLQVRDRAEAAVRARQSAGSG